MGAVVQDLARWARALAPDQHKALDAGDPTIRTQGAERIADLAHGLAGGRGGEVLTRATLTCAIDLDKASQALTGVGVVGEVGERVVAGAGWAETGQREGGGSQLRTLEARRLRATKCSTPLGLRT